MKSEEITNEKFAPTKKKKALLYQNKLESNERILSINISYTFLIFILLKKKVLHFLRPDGRDKMIYLGILRK